MLLPNGNKRQFVCRVEEIKMRSMAFTRFRFPSIFIRIDFNHFAIALRCNASTEWFPLSHRGFIESNIELLDCRTLEHVWPSRYKWIQSTTSYQLLASAFVRLALTLAGSVKNRGRKGVSVIKSALNKYFYVEFSLVRSVSCVAERGLHVESHFYAYDM